jgi:peptide/nickel transport system substrate-binding protein
VESPGTDYQYVGINLRDPALKDVRVRHALGYAIDRQAIVDYLRRGLATPADGMLPPSNWAYEPNVFKFTHDPARARRLLDEAGYLDPDGDGPVPRLSLSLKTTSAEFQRLQAAAIQQDLRKVGIEVDVRTYEFATLYADVLKGNFQTYILQWVGGAVADPDILRRVFHSQQVPPVGFNRGHFSDPEIDRLIDRAAASTDAAPYISLWHKTNFALSKSDLEGIHLSPNADFAFLRNLHRRSTRSPSN